MQSPEQPVLRDIVRVGGGHSHAGVLNKAGRVQRQGDALKPGVLKC